MVLTEISCENGMWTYMTQDSVLYRALALAVLKLGF
jgi:hypothetical protein